MATFGAALFALAVVLFVLGPVLTGRQAVMVRTDEEVGDAEAWQTVALRALRDVEYDYHTGKLDAADYQRLKVELTVEAVDALRRAKAEVSPGEEVSEAEIASATAAIEALVRSGVTCSACAHLNPENSRFCAACGTALEAGDPVGEPHPA